MRAIRALFKLTLFSLVLLFGLIAIDLRLKEVECERCAVWEWEVCKEMKCPVK